MSLFTEVLSKLKPKNWQNGNHFFVLDSHYVEFAYQATVNYPCGAIVIFQGKFYQRNQVVTDYNPGIAPTNSNYWIAANPGRDIGDHLSLLDLQTAHPNPAPGSIATVEDEDAFYKWDNDNGEWVPISGGGGSDLLVLFDSDLDTVSPPLMFKGLIENIQINLPVNLASYSFQARLNGGSSSVLADINALQSWINTNVVADDTLWILEIIVSYSVGETGEAIVLMQYEKTSV
ncbi:hypothetical protein OKW21_005049 [Catalinimonas alkaloidigena]|uniref:hypothetical protein n=1 Tax=Catalinimonas alkaloidigena TaxID=1075417 RepID=UPI0024062BA5|nr:hypothetical protein [Catalinimonas alkaloidigena]MDF9799786.1 hypothetical protein [Catalinimonas alkaloidigena]